MADCHDGGVPPADCDRLAKQLDRLDARDAIAAMLFATYAGYPASTRSGSIRAPAFVCEYIVMRLLARGNVAPTAPRAEVLVEELVIQAEAAATMAAIPVLAGPDDDPTRMEFDARRRFEVSQLLVYDPAIAELEVTRWPRLLSPFATEIEAITGVSPGAIERIGGTLIEGSVAWTIHHAGVTDPPPTAEGAMALARDAVRAGAGRHVVHGAGEELALSRDELAHVARASRSEVDAFVDLFATTAAVGTDRPFAHFVWELRRRPVLDWDGTLMLPVPSDLIMAFRPTLETALREGDPAAAARYAHDKGKWVEREALDVLTELLDPDQTYRNVRTPARRGTTDHEHDGLMRLDLAALAIEVKGGGVAPAARRGQADSQDKAFKNLIHEGVAQADELVATLRAGEEVTGVVDGAHQRVDVDLGNIDRWIPLVVTLEDMSGVVAAHRAAFGGRAEDEPYPVVVTLDDLVWFGRELPLSAQVMHYLVVRERIGRSGVRLIMFDESDWFGFYCGNGGAGVRRWLDELGDIDVPMMTTGSNNRRGALDPRILPWSTPLAPVLRRWQKERRDGWLEASMAILDLGADQADALENLISAARRQARQEVGAIGVVTMRPDGDPDTALHILVPTEAGELAADELGSLIGDTAPGATAHVITWAPRDDPRTLELLAVAELRMST